MEIPAEQNRLDELVATVAQLTRRQYEAEQRIHQLERALAEVDPTVRVALGHQIQTTPEFQEQKLEVADSQPMAAMPVEQSPPPLPLLFEPIDQPVREQSSFAKPREPVLETKLGLTVLNRIGVVTLVVGVAFFFKWAVDSNLIGPAGRVMLGIFAGFAAMGVADWLWRKGQQIFAQGVTGAGVAILYLSFYAAFDFYHLIPQSLAFALMFVATGMTVALALRYNAIAIAMLGFAGGYLTPLLLSTGPRRLWFLFSYILVLDIGAMMLVRRRSWRPLELLSFGATVLLYGAWLLGAGSRTSEQVVGTVALAAYYALYWSASIGVLSSVAQLLAALAVALIWQGSAGAYFGLEMAVTAGGLALWQERNDGAALGTTFASFWFSYLIWKSDYHQTLISVFLGITAVFALFHVGIIRRLLSGTKVADMQTLLVFVMNGVVYFATAYGLLHSLYNSYLGILALAVAATYLTIGFQLYRVYQRASESAGRSPQQVMLALGMALGSLTLAIPVQFTGYTITLSWAIEAATLTWIALQFESRRAMAGALAIFGFVSFRLVVLDAEMYSRATAYGLAFNARFLTFLVSAATLLLAARWAARMARDIGLIEYLAGLIVLLAGLSLEVIGWAERSTPYSGVLSVETVGLSILFAVYALVLVGIGVWSRTIVNRIAGLVLMGVVIVKLYLFDVWQLDRVYRISAFVVLGLLLISTSFLYSRFRRIVEGWLKDEEVAS